MKPWKSVAYWPDSIKCSNEHNTSEDFHDTESQARGVCKLLRMHGYGGEGRVFPIKTEVVSSETVVPSEGGES